MADYRALAQALDPYAIDTGTPDAIKMFQSGYKLPNFLGMTASQPTPQEIERMVAEQSPAFGVFPQMKPYRSEQDITASANVPVDLLRGRVAGTRGLFGDVVNQPIPMVRPLQLLSQAVTGQQKYPDTEHYLDTMPLKSNTPIGDVAGRMGSFAPINPMPAVRAGQKGLNLLGMEVADRLATGRSVLPSLLKEPQSAMFATEPSKKGLFNIFDESTKYHQKIPEIKNINVANLKRMNAGEVADVSDEVAANMDFSKPIQVSVFSDGEMRIVDGHHRVAAAKKLGISSLPVELQAINARGNTLNKLAQESAYPQQSALNLAQERASLPVEKTGLPTSITNKSEVKNVADDFANQFKQMGFDVTLDHSGSKVGASSYLRVSDPTTGRFLNKPIRISDHSKGAKELDANINVLNPQEDLAKITSILTDMRKMGATLAVKQNKYAQELIANGVKPKTAYQKAKTEIAE